MKMQRARETADYRQTGFLPQGCEKANGLYQNLSGMTFYFLQRQVADPFQADIHV